MARRTYAQDQGIDTSALDELFLGILQSRRDQAGKLAALAAQDKLAATRQRQELEDRKTIADIEHQNRLALEAQKQTDEFANKEDAQNWEYVTTLDKRTYDEGVKAKDAADKKAVEQQKARNIVSVAKKMMKDPEINWDAPDEDVAQQIEAKYGTGVLTKGLGAAPSSLDADIAVNKNRVPTANLEGTKAQMALDMPDALQANVRAGLAAPVIANETADLSNAFTPVPLGASYVNMKPLEGRQLLMRTPGLAEQRTQTIDPKTGMPVESISPAVPGQMNLLPSVNAVRAAHEATLMEGVNKAANKAFVGDITGLTNSLGDLPIVPATSQAAPQVVPSTAQRQPVGGLVGLGQQAAKSVSPYLYPEEPPVMSPLTMVNDMPAAMGNLGMQALIGRSPFMMMTQPNMVKTVNGWIPAAENLVDPRVRRPFSYR